MFTLYSPFNNLLAETQVKKEASELGGEPYDDLMNFSSESYSPSGSIGLLSEWSKETHSESIGNVKYGPEDDRKPLSTLLGSWVGRGRSRNKNLLNTRYSR